jgi:hypothetical protein
MENVKSSSEFHEIERSIVAILEDLEKVTKSRTSNINRLKHFNAFMVIQAFFA